MTKVTAVEMAKLAKLSRIKLDKSEEEKLTNQISEIISWVESLNEVETKDVEPMMAVENDLPLREDEVDQNSYKDDVLKNAPEEQYDFYAVPKFL
jgi:aspartyl-tRNA(Asn)/glutamyl-tRNA(Gln) amidotransferase subunit C